MSKWLLLEMSENVWKWQPQVVSPILLMKMKNVDRDVTVGDDDQFKQKPTIPETYRAAPLNLGPECIHHKKHLISKLYMSNQLSKIKEERQEDVRNINQNVKSLPVKIRYVEIGLFCMETKGTTGIDIELSLCVAEYNPSEYGWL
jgi:hypothetical protein